MVDHPALCEQIGAFFSGKLNLDIPSADTDLIETGIIDSLALVDLIVYLESLGVDISLDEIEIDNFRSLSKIAEFAAGNRATVAVS